MKTPPKKKTDKKTASKKSQDPQRVMLPVVHKSTTPALRDPFQQYMAEVSRYPLLSHEEEDKVARHYKQYQDKKSAQLLVLSNLRLVVKIAMEYSSVYHNLMDLIQEGNLGLMRAVEKYDVDKNVRFSTYAVWWVRAYVLKFILDNFRLVKVGTTQAQKKLFFNLMREKENMEKLGFAPTTRLLADKLGVKENEVNQMEVRMGAREVELDAPKANYDGQARNMDFVTGESGKAIEDAVEQGELKDILLKNLDAFTKSLSEKERQIFFDRLFSEFPKTLQEIADQYKISRERIRQIEERTIKKMRTFFSEKGMSVDIHPEKQAVKS